MRTEFAVLADDLTGANASAVVLRSAGLRPVIGWGETLPPGGNALVVDMRTRDRAIDPYCAAREWAEKLASLGVERVELRMDSTLRGATALELDGLLHALGADRPVVVIPAFPSAGRVTQDGRQLTDGAPLAHGGSIKAAVLAGRPSMTITTAVLRRGPAAAVDAVERAIKNGARNFILDGTQEADLREAALVVETLETMGYSLVTVSPGAWLRHMSVHSYVLVVIGSATDLNRAQVRRLPVGPQTLRIRLGSPDAMPDVRGPIGSRAASMIIVDTLNACEPGDRLLEALARHATEAMASAGSSHCAGIIISGGHTASHVLDALSCHSVVPLAEPEPLCAAGILRGGPWDGTYVVTKGGLVGNVGTLHQLREWLVARAQPEHELAAAAGPEFRSASSPEPSLGSRAAAKHAQVLPTSAGQTS